MFLYFVTCLQSGKNRPSRSHKTIIIDNYEVTIFPAESVNHSHTIPAQSAMPSQKCDPEMKLGAEPYSTWFYDLQGKIYISNLQGVSKQFFLFALFWTLSENGETIHFRNVPCSLSMLQ